MDVLFDLYRLAPHKHVQWPPFLNIFLKRIIESGLVHITEASDRVFLEGMQASPNRLVITDGGRKFIDELGLKEL